MSSHPPIAVMSFNRPDYLRQVLASIAAQEGVEIEKREVFLFQDGAVNAYSGRVCAEEADIAACIAVFQEIFPNGTVLASPHNLGVCENFLRAEKKFFEAMQAECGYFFEDDLVLAPRYMAVMDGMRQAAARSGQVGYFACYGHLQASAEEQQRNAQLLRRLGHLWGFGLFRQHWLEMQPVMAEYYAMVVGKDYKARPSAEIQKRYRERGILVGVTSQDDVKKAVTYSLGRVALNTQICNARYIGEIGLHSNAQSFARGGFANTVILPMQRLDFIFPDAAAIAAIRADEEEKRRKNIASEEARAAEKLAARAAAKAPPMPAPKLPLVAVPPPQPGMATAKLGPPRMSAEERALFESVLASGRRRYAEFGTGGSTLLAVRQGFDMLVGVESDPAWADAVRQDPEVGQAIAAGRASILHGDIGPVGKWGSPVDRAGLHRWPGYIATMWQEWDRRAAFPDLVLVDGRFRVACCLSVALLAAARGGKEAPLLVLHDVSDRRPNYRLVNDFFHLERQAGTLCVYAPRQLVSPEAIMAAFLGRLFEVG
jgi:hypothetical protein